MPDIPRRKLLNIIDGYRCIISRSETTIDREMIDKATTLEFIARAAVGFGNIDVEYATQKGILVFNTPGVNTNSAAELTLSLLLAVCRKVVSCHKHMDNGKWDRHQFLGTELKGKTVGIIGLGDVGQRVAKFMHIMGCSLLVYDPFITDEKSNSMHAKRLNLESLIAQSDIITVHTPLNKDTYNMINGSHLQMMKDGVYLINAARGGIIEEKMMLEGLDRGKISGIGLDTWETEPPENNPFTHKDNVVMTAHIGASTHEAQKGIAESVINDVLACFKGGQPYSPLNIPKMNLMPNDEIRDYTVLVGQLGKITAGYIDTNFNPTGIEFLYRGKFEEKNWTLIKLAFLKSLLGEISNINVNFVNALRIAEDKGYKIMETKDEDFTVYNSAIRIRVFSNNETFTIGGTVLGKNNIRLTFLKDIAIEILPFGRLLIVENLDQPGVVGFIGGTLGDGGVNINQFHLGRCAKGGNALCITSLDSSVPPKVVRRLAEHSDIVSVKVIDI